MYVKFIYSEKTIKFCEISAVDLTVTTYDKLKMEVLQNFVAFSECMNFIKRNTTHLGYEEAFLSLILAKKIGERL